MEQQKAKTGGARTARTARGEQGDVQGSAAAADVREDVSNREAVVGGDAAPGERGGIQVIARAAAVLRAISGHPEGMSLGEIARAVQLPRSTIQRLVQALEDEGWVEAGGPGGVRIGAGLVELAGAPRLDIAVIGAPFLQHLFEAVRETVDVSAARGTEVVFLRRIESDQELRVSTGIVRPLPLHCMANGKALLSMMSDAQVERLMGGPPVPMTPQSIDSLERLRDELARIRAEGVAYDREEHADGVCAIGMPIRTADGRRYAVSIATPTLRFERSLPLLTEALRVCQHDIERAFDARLAQGAHAIASS